ncbi:hypothetical protein RRF57_007906 [Xylaria bambusicola]|uniref:Uncharacterized protein n=1 Tax=Xylaria bambusicola TaxID=326684 RepID=A0AAN7USQ6_9PEZI
MPVLVLRLCRSPPRPPTRPPNSHSQSTPYSFSIVMWLDATPISGTPRQPHINQARNLPIFLGTQRFGSLAVRPFKSFLPRRRSNSSPKNTRASEISTDFRNKFTR